MKLLAHVTHGSPVYRRWHAQTKRVAALNGVVFTLVSGIYKSGVLDKDQVEAVRGNESVVLTLLGTLPQATVEAINETVAEQPKKNQQKAKVAPAT